jgi:site-specific DNA recombinase
MIDSYTEGLIKKSDFDPKMMQLKVNLERVQQQIDASKQQRAGQVEPFPAINRLEEFTAAVNDRLSHLDFNNQLEIIRALVKRIEIYHDEIVVVLRVDPDPDIGADDDDEDESDRSAETSSMQDCKRRTLPDGGRHGPRRVGAEPACSFPRPSHGQPGPLCG